jgi:hypothetical protein
MKEDSPVEKNILMQITNRNVANFVIADGGYALINCVVVKNQPLNETIR